jgi:nicotinamidase-related amidase
VTYSKYEASRTGLLLVDPFNDFLSEGGKLWPAAKEVAEEVGLLDNLRAIVSTARSVGVRVFFVPHHRWIPGDFDSWKYPNRTQIASGKRQTFALGSWGGTFHDDFQPQEGDVVATEHWAQSGFANTDLDQKLKQYDVDKIVVVGMLANTCIESTARFGMELGYHVTLVKDATAAFSKEAMHCAHSVNGPTFAHEILTTAEIVEIFKSFRSA